MAYVKQAAEGTLIRQQRLPDSLAYDPCTVAGFPHGHVLTLATATVFFHAIRHDGRSIVVHVVIPQAADGLWEHDVQVPYQSNGFPVTT